MAMLMPPQTPPASSTESYINPAFTTDSLEDEESSPVSIPSESPRHYAFTPRRASRQPRAWERKPATPFAPRVEGHRIWKRIPLAENPGSSNVQPQTREKHQDAVKVVKKRRADGDENATFLSTKLEVLEDAERRKLSTNLGEAATKLLATADNISEEAQAILLDVEAEANQGLEGPAMDEVDEALFDHLLLSRAQFEEALSTATGCEAGDRIEADASERVAQFVANEISAVTATVTKETACDDSDLVASAQVISDMEHYIVDGIIDQMVSNEAYDVGLVSETGDTTGEEEPGSINDKAETDADDKSNQHVSSAPASESQPHELTEEPVESRTKGSRGRSDLDALFTGSGLIEPAAESETSLTSPALHSQRLSSPVDDTAFLHAFLTRTRAQKAAKASTSPEKKHSTTHYPPEMKSQSEQGKHTTKDTGPEDDYAQEAEEEVCDAAATSPCRRSARTRLPQPQRPIPVTPSNIPVRRSNGTEFIFLQRTEAQEVALATRANTRRNKGDATQPRYRLPYINDCDGRQTSPAESPRKKKSGRKEVAWNEKLIDVHDDILETEEDGIDAETENLGVDIGIKPAARKVKRLGTVNGTPAPKRTMETCESQIPARRLRSRSRT